MKRHPATATQLVKAGIFPNTDRAGKRLKTLENKSEPRVRSYGYVKIDGKRELLWSKGHVSKPQHEAEITEYLLNIDVDTVRRGLDVDKFDTDFILEVNGNRYYGEHDRDTKNHRQIKAKFRKLADCPCDVLWIVPDETRLRELVKMAPNDLHWFTTFHSIRTDPHGPVWVNRFGEIESLERSAA